MKSVGIRELKARLSHYLDEIERGEVVLVTNRHRVVAELRSPGSAVETPRDPFEQRLQRWVLEGRACAGAPNQPEWYRRSPLRCAPGTAERVLDELREEP